MLHAYFGELSHVNPDSAQILHQVLYFNIVSRPQFWTELSETDVKTSEIALALRSHNNCLNPNHSKRVLAVSVDPCSKIRNQNPTEITQL